MKQMLKKILAILIVAITIMTNISLGVSSQDSKDLQDKINYMENSRSWKITKPLRNIRKKYNKI